MKRILFLTSTRADFGKLRPLIHQVDAHPDFEAVVFVTGMHTLELYGYTVLEVRNAGFKNLHVHMNQFLNEPMDLVLANTISGLSRFVHEDTPDLIVVHGDRVEALAGAVVGALRNILVAHVEGGELSGTVDDLIRHAVSKLSHLHCVANREAATRLRQLGEDPDTIFVVGSPDIDVMLASDQLPDLSKVRAHYQITAADYAIVLFHPVTTEKASMRNHANALVDALLGSDQDYIVVYPNNDEGTNLIFEAYRRLEGNARFRIFPSIKFESFLTLMKHARFIIGNSSAGIREAPIYGLPTVNIGTRQTDRFRWPSIIDCQPTASDILAAIGKAREMQRAPVSHHFGKGDSARRFMDMLMRPETWRTSVQKGFVDLAEPQRAVRSG